MVDLDIRRVCGPCLVTPRSGRPVLEVKVYLWESLSCGSFVWPVSGSQPWRVVFRSSHRAVCSDKSLSLSVSLFALDLGVYSSFL